MFSQALNMLWHSIIRKVLASMPSGMTAVRQHLLQLHQLAGVPPLPAQRPVQGARARAVGRQVHSLTAPAPRMAIHLHHVVLGDAGAQGVIDER